MDAAASPSFNSVVLGLQPGEHACKARKVDSSLPVGKLGDLLPDMRQQLRSACLTAITRAKARTGATYRTEVGDVAMPGGTFYVVAVITREP